MPGLFHVRFGDQTQGLIFAWQHLASCSTSQPQIGFLILATQKVLAKVGIVLEKWYQGVLTHVFHLNAQDTEAVKALSLRPAWPT